MDDYFTVGRGESEFEAAKSWQQRALLYKRERDEAREMLGECYVQSGADPDGNGWQHLWRHAVDAVRELRRDYDQEEGAMSESQRSDEPGVIAMMEAIRNPHGVRNLGGVVVATCQLCKGGGRSGAFVCAACRGAGVIRL